MIDNDKLNISDLISIIIPCYNDAEFVEQAVNSALNQTYQHKEVIVVDDGSNAITKEILKRLDSTRVKLITQENSGQSKARNVGIDKANGDYILVLDSDDYFEPTFCDKALGIFKSSGEEIKIVSCYANLLLDDGKKLEYKPQGGTIQDFLFFNQVLGTSMFKREDWRNCGGYDESMRNGFEDWEFFIRILKNGGKALVIQELLYNYRKRSDSTTQIANGKKYELIKYIFLKHRELYINNFESTISHLLCVAERERKEKIKNTNRLEFKIGQIVLKPIRWVKLFLE